MSSSTATYKEEPKDGGNDHVPNGVSGKEESSPSDAQASPPASTPSTLANADDTAEKKTVKERIDSMFSQSIAKNEAAKRARDSDSEGEEESSSVASASKESEKARKKRKKQKKKNKIKEPNDFDGKQN